eukprot:6608248-Prymnesium_polylepis.1
MGLFGQRPRARSVSGCGGGVVDGTRCGNRKTEHGGRSARGGCAEDALCEIWLTGWILLAMRDGVDVQAMTMRCDPVRSPAVRARVPSGTIGSTQRLRTGSG